MKHAIYLSLATIMVGGSVSGETGMDKNFSATAFVQDFVHWYLPLAIKNDAVPSWTVAIRTRRSIFSKTLYEQLRCDAVAEKEHEDVVGLDFDPFLYSQDPDTDYAVKMVNKNGNIYRISISPKNSPNVKEYSIVDLSFGIGGWKIENVEYPGSGTLLSALAALRKERGTAKCASDSSHRREHEFR